MSYHYETLSKRQPQWLVILTKFHDGSSKIVDFLLVVNFWLCPGFFESVSIRHPHSTLFSHTARMTLVSTSDQVLEPSQINASDFLQLQLLRKAIRTAILLRNVTQHFYKPPNFVCPKVGFHLLIKQSGAVGGIYKRNFEMLIQS